MSAATWPEPVRRVAAFLREAGAEARLEELDVPTPTAQDAARVIGCELAEIVKTLVFRCDGHAVAVLIPGDRRADTGRIAAVLGCGRLRIAAPAEVAAATGFAPGAVAPFPLPGVRRVLVERTVLARDRVWVGAGSERHLAGLAPAELVRLARATPAHVVAYAT